MKSLYTKEGNESFEEEDNNDSVRDVLFMALIQDDNLGKGAGSSIKGVQVTTSKPSKKWTYNGIYIYYPKSKAEENPICTKESSKS